MANVAPSIIEYDFFPDDPPAVVGQLPTGKNVSIELWQDGNPVSINNSDAQEIGNTGRYSWSTANINSISASRVQYHFRMTASGTGETDQGDFILVAPNNTDGGMPSLNNTSEYIIKN